MAVLEGAVAPDPGDHLAVFCEAEEEQRDAIALLELLAPERPFEAVVSVDPLGLVEVELPEVRSENRVVSLEADSREAIDKARAISVPTSYDVSHD
jgi:hypothetical protein